MSTDVEQLADELVQLLTDRGWPADRFQTGPLTGTAGVNVWGHEGRYPMASITISDSGNFHDYAWGRNYEHKLPIDTAPTTVVDEVLKTLTTFTCEECGDTSVWVDTDDRFEIGRAVSVICWCCELILASFDSVEELAGTGPGPQYLMASHEPPTSTER